MSFSVGVGLLLALGTAFGSVAGFLYKSRGAREAPAVEFRRPLRSSVELFRSPLYVLEILSHLNALGAGVLVHPLAFVILTASLAGLLVSARSLQLGDAVPVIVLTSAAANLCTIAAGRHGLRRRAAAQAGARRTLNASAVP